MDVKGTRKENLPLWTLYSIPSQTSGYAIVLFVFFNVSSGKLPDHRMNMQYTIFINELAFELFTNTLKFY